MMDTQSTEPRFLSRDEGASIAYHTRAGKPEQAPDSGNRACDGILFCGGFNSNMAGTKARHLDAFCTDNGLGYTRFDYQGHGQSSGRFQDGSIGLWAADALAVLDHAASGRQLIIGSSMGAWIAMLLAKARPERVAGLILIAPAPDFAQRLMWPSLPESARQQILETGSWNRPSEFEDEDYPITRHLIDESREHHLLDGPPVAFHGPVRILQGDGDEVVPVPHALAPPGLLLQMMG